MSKPNPDRGRYVELVRCMATDTMLGKGPTPHAFVNNLRLIATAMEEILQDADCPPDRYFLDKVPDYWAKAQRREPSRGIDMSEHPEHRCQKCKMLNPLWFAPNDLWNRVHSVYPEFNILCPTCFMNCARSLPVPLDVVWEVKPEEVV